MIRRTRALHCLCVLVAGGLIFGCVVEPEAQREAPVADQLSIRECGPFISMRVDESLQMALQSFPSTGYVWHATEQDTSHLSVSAAPASPYRLLANDDLQRFDIHAYRAGRSTLRWELRSPWGADSPAAAVCEISLTTGG